MHFFLSFSPNSHFFLTFLLASKIPRRELPFLSLILAYSSTTNYYASYKPIRTTRPQNQPPPAFLSLTAWAVCLVCNEPIGSLSGMTLGLRKDVHIDRCSNPSAFDKWWKQEPDGRATDTVTHPPCLPWARKSCLGYLVSRRSNLEKHCSHPALPHHHLLTWPSVLTVPNIILLPVTLRRRTPSFSNCYKLLKL